MPIDSVTMSDASEYLEVLLTDGRKGRVPAAVLVNPTTGLPYAASGGGGGGGGGDASAANQTTQITAANLTNTRVGDLTESAPGTDTASSGINGRLQRIAQRLTSLLGAVTGSTTTATLLALTTNATGPTYTAFGSQACTSLTVINARAGAVDLQIRRGSSGETMILPAGAFWTFVGLTNANQIEVRRADTSNTQVTINAEAVSA